VPKGEAYGDDHADENTDQKEPSVGGKSDQEDKDDSDGDEQRGGAFESEAEARL
jgi:hypothetical protein